MFGNDRIYGLTATPTRQDGHHPILSMYLGDIRYRVDAKAQAEKRPFTHVMIPRFTGACFHLDQEAKTPAIGQYYAQILEDDLRNHMIVDDVLACVKEGRNCLLLSERTRHVTLLAELLGQHGLEVLVMTGGKTNAETNLQMERLQNASADKPLIICATGKYIGEGFDEARLDTLFLTMPISWQGTLAQYAGRLHRLYDGKREVRIYDYIDSNAEMLENSYMVSLTFGASGGFSLWADTAPQSVSIEITFSETPLPASITSPGSFRVNGSTASEAKSAFLTWNASTLTNASGTITYYVYKNGSMYASTQDTSYTISEAVLASWGEFVLEIYRAAAMPLPRRV